MNYFESLILGIIQGTTEFLPVSSSGHLVIFQNLFNIVSDNVAFEVVVHLGTLMSVIVVYYSDIAHMAKSFFTSVFSGNISQAYKNDSYFKLALLVLVGTIPAVFTGLVLADFFKEIFHNIKLVSSTLILTGVILFITRFVKVQNQKNTVLKALIIGLGQAMAILPGISRSGTTISTSLFMGLGRKESARFSFLMSIPVIVGAASFELNDFFSEGFTSGELGVMLIGFVSSFITGYIAIKFMLKVIQTGKFSWFAPYCIATGLLVLLVL